MKNLLALIILVITFSVTKGQSSFHSFLDSIAKISETTAKVELAEAYIALLEESGFPYIEGDTANFIYYGEADSVKIAGDFNGWGGNWKCTQIPETNFFYFSQIFEQTARLDYKFIVNASNWILDPRNPNQVSGGYGPNSELAMPGYVQPWEIEEYEDVAKGTLESFSLESPQVGRTFNIQVYLPPGYEEAGNFAYSTVYVHDGSEYISLGSMDNVLNNLLDSNKIEPLIAVFISPRDRNDEYAYDNRYNFAQFIVETVVPYIDSAYKTYPHSSHRLTMGASFGGNISAIISYTYPEVFANSGWHSPALWPNEGEAADLFYSGDKKDVKIYFNVGTYENLGIQWLDFTSGLDVKGYTYDWKSYHEGHSWGFWRATIDDILIYFFPPGTTPVGMENTGVETNQRSMIFPNPADSHATVEVAIDKPGDYRIDVFNQLGQLQTSSGDYYNSGRNLKFELDVSDFSSGIYHYVVRGGQMSHSGKIVVN